MIVFIAVLALGVGVSGLAGAQQKIVIYAAQDEKTTNEMTRMFTDETKIATEVIRVAAAGTLATRIRAEKAAPKADVFMGGSVEFHEPLAMDGLVLPYRSPVVEQAKIDLAYVSPQNSWHGFFVNSLVIILNPERFQKEVAAQGIPKPQTWDDLLNPAYRKKVIAGNPATCGGAYIFSAAQVFRLGGEDAGFDWLKKLDAQVSQYTPTCPGTITLVTRGEGVAGITWADDSIEAMLAKQPLEVIFPPDTAAEIGGLSIIKGGPNPEGAKKWVDFALGKRAQALKTELGFTYPVRSDVDPPKNVPPLSAIKLGKYDRKFAIENRERLTKKWEAEIGSKR
jgi:iron(III) transport system substrate-binding protein